MRSAFFLEFAAIVVAAATVSSAATSTGSSTGFAAGTTGGGSATPVYPTTVDELSSYLSDDDSDGTA
ncbi:unnamed protein product [Phytophthora lilii]|uniref:Unnamed protein product n=1 Tax=Phytophthora lilii TaxID=2077276 RepID=A0A9W6YEA9_9STRA|nr:unnamed protein product [Phytophthora lilii]